VPPADQSLPYDVLCLSGVPYGHRYTPVMRWRQAFAVGLRESLAIDRPEDAGDEADAAGRTSLRVPGRPIRSRLSARISVASNGCSRTAQQRGETEKHLQITGGRTWIRTTDLFLIRAALCPTATRIRRASPPVPDLRIPADTLPARRLVTSRSITAEHRPASSSLRSLDRAARSRLADYPCAPPTDDCKTSITCSTPVAASRNPPREEAPSRLSRASSLQAELGRLPRRPNPVSGSTLTSPIERV